jgi:GalNAc-alpha-(1->4)-GalNAc-alpha-(1->3)-diNAcBac-PP-undecaprenol alpha-1,4-N-acetyl-D-galactosaminyltransferase
MNSGGAERVAANLVNAWVARGDIVTLVITYSGQGECFYELDNRVELIYLAERAGIFGRSLRAYWLRFKALRRLIRDSRPDAVLSFLINVNIGAILATRGLGQRVIVSERSYPPARTTDYIYSWLRRKTYPWADRVVMLTSEGLTWLRECIPDAVGSAIPNAVLYPIPNFEPRLSPDSYVSAGRRLLLAVGRLNDGKQFDRLLDAFAALAPKYPLWDLVILGEGEEHSALEMQCKALNLEGRSFLPGAVGNLGDWYARADLYVMSSRFEGFPNTLVEAMACGCPAVSYDCDTGPRDIIHHERNGLLVDPVGNVTALTRALERLIGDDAERERMSKQAVEVRARYSMPRILAMWDALFDVAMKADEKR